MCVKYKILCVFVKKRIYNSLARMWKINLEIIYV